jgi:Fe-S cluster assembly ATPase SufC
MMNGKIVMSGDKELALRLEEEGYDKVREEVEGKEAVSA